ncbi:MAG: ATP-dependent RNA helicase HrpA, partial [Acidimicrobiales bacterium]
PITARRDDLAAAIRDHQVVIVAGETGSGKTTQLPKICLELGRGVAGTIGHTQPRRIAARNVAERIAAELDTPLGQAIGYTVRFTDRVSDTTLVRVMTDGILLAEIQRDRMLRRYDTLIIDEAHERSLNIDFLLGYLKSLLPRRPDLKVIITSATIDTARFSAHFDDAPVVQVTGRSYPVEVRYRPLDWAADDRAADDGPSAAADDNPRDQTQAIVDAVAELGAEGQSGPLSGASRPGDILVFLSGEREIRDTADALSKAAPDPGGGRRDQTEILPLYARLSAAEQQRVFQPHPGRRVVLATNVAETSLTVPGIRYVVDPGTARISRYSRRTKVQRLPIEPISQASANQRAGRCGRVAPGICIRLYAEDDFAGRPEFTEPEILRTNLASVILQMAAIGLGDVAAFPFVDPPDHRAIADGMALLHELGALRSGPEGDDGAARLTAIGRWLAQLPVDPRLGRMVLEAERLGALREVTIVAAGLSIQDPRERPADKQQAAAEAHARFADADSDFVSWLNLWAYLAGLQKELSGNQFRKRCRAEYLNYLRVREWQDIAAQIRHVLRAQGVRANREPATPDTVHRALLAGLLSQIGVRQGESRDYLGARSARFAIAPGSDLARKQPRWVMAGELVETNRLWARTVARIAPEWIERAGAHLVQRSYGDPQWDARAGAAMTVERVTLYGVPVVTGRRVLYSRIDRDDARDIFIQEGLVEGDWETHHAFPAANRKVLDEARARRRTHRVDELSLFDFYDTRVPAGVASGRDFDAWWRKVRAGQPDLLTLTAGMLLGPESDALDPSMFPDLWPQGEVALPVSYEWQPGADDDGVTVSVPLSVLDRITPDGFDWQVPGLRPELIVALIRSLPKVLRRHFVPAPESAAAFLEAQGPADGRLSATLAAWLRRSSG